MTKQNAEEQTAILATDIFTKGTREPFLIKTDSIHRIINDKS